MSLPPFVALHMVLSRNRGANIIPEASYFCAHGCGGREEHKKNASTRALLPSLPTWSKKKGSINLHGASTTTDLLLLFCT